MVCLRAACSVAHQSASRREFTKLINRRNCVVRCQSYYLRALTEKEGIGSDEKRPYSLSNEGLEAGIDLGFITGIQNKESNSQANRRLLRVAQLRLSTPIMRIH